MRSATWKHVNLARRPAQVAAKRQTCPPPGWLCPGWDLIRPLTSLQVLEKDKQQIKNIRRCRDEASEVQSRGMLDDRGVMKQFCSVCFEKKGRGKLPPRAPSSSPSSSSQVTSRRAKLAIVLRNLECYAGRILVVT